jgi:hypothetical protein
MRVAKLPQLSPNRHASNTSSSFGQLFYRRVLMPVNAGLELRSIGNLVRMPMLIATFCLHIARGFFARQPGRNGITVHP